jgi:tetraacyldisaccharide 4'-kinase
VGNITVGGTGKTPVTEYLIQFFLDRGIRPVVLSRGYGRKTKGFRYVEAGDRARTLETNRCR